MKYGDTAWTEPEPGGGDTTCDGRLRDSAWLQPPEGGWVEPGGQFPEKLPTCHLVDPVVPPVATIDVAQGTPEAPAVLTFTGDYVAGTSVILEYVAETFDPGTGVHTFQSDMTEKSAAEDFASYIDGGAGFSAKAVDNTVEFTPVAPATTVDISGLVIDPPFQSSVEILVADGTTSVPAQLTTVGFFRKGEVVTFTATLDDQPEVSGSFEMLSDASNVVAAGLLAAELQKADGIKSLNSENNVILLVPDAPYALLTMVSVVVTPVGGAAASTAKKAKKSKSKKAD